MSKNVRRWVIEMACILFCLLITVLMGSYFYKGGILSGTLMMHLFSAFYVGSSIRMLSPFFFFFLFVIYYARSIWLSFRVAHINLLAMAGGTGLITALVYFLDILDRSERGYTMYPPLSALPGDKLPGMNSDGPVSNLIGGLLVTQLITIIMIIYLLYQWRRISVMKKKSLVS